MSKKALEAEKKMGQANACLAWARWYGSAEDVARAEEEAELARRDYCKSISDHAGAFYHTHATRTI